jgi:hypothetical protein
MTDAEIKELVAGLVASTSKLNEKSDKIDAQMAKTDAKLDRLAQMYGGVADNQGSAAEEFFFNSLNSNPVLGNIQFNRVSKSLKASTPQKQAEFDIVLVNGNAVALVEVKYKVHPNALDQVQSQLSLYREFFPEHKDFKLYGGIAGFSIPDEVSTEAHERGLFVLKRKGDAYAVDTAGMRAF